MSALEEVRLEAIPPEVIVRVMLTLDRAADDFLGDCRRRGFSERTLTTYRRTYNELCDRIPDDLDVSKVTTDMIRRYLASKSHLAPGTVAGCEAHLSSLFRWLVVERKIARDPMALLPRTKRQRAEDLDVTSVTPDDVRLLLFHAHGWSERLAIAVLAYLGPRRHATANLKITDYDQGRRRLRFREKGGKTIWKPVPDELDQLIEAALAAGVYEDQPYLIPPRPKGYLTRKGDRDDRVIWRIVKDVADKAGVEAHTHALRAAFACFYDEAYPGDILALRDLMGHSSVKTTELYLRRRDKEAGMEKVRDLSWGVSMASDGDVVRQTSAGAESR